MKHIILIVLVFVGIASFAQNKNAKASLEVDGVCMMCKSRIEKACLGTKGVKSANWDVETHKLVVYYDERKTKLETIIQAVTEAGHDTKILKASDEAYAKVHPCCRYREDKVKDDHQ